jgi:hypothetical protein
MIYHELRTVSLLKTRRLFSPLSVNAQSVLFRQLFPVEPLRANALCEDMSVQWVTVSADAKSVADCES